VIATGTVVASNVAVAPLPERHAVYVVAINGRGQVVAVKPDVSSHDRAFDALTYGNALQAFIRTPDGQAIPGTYALEYELAPGTESVRRSVRLLHAGGVDANALGAVVRMRSEAERKAHGHR